MTCARIRRLAFVAASAGLIGFATLALAHEEATGVVKERMDLMECQKDDMKLIGDMAKGKTPFDPAKAAEAARDIETTSGKIPDLFPEGSTGHPSEAKEEIWAGRRHKAGHIGLVRLGKTFA